MKRSALLVALLVANPILGNSSIEQAIIGSNPDALRQALGDEPLSEHDTARYIKLADEIIQHRRDAIFSNNLKPKNGPLPQELEQKRFQEAPLALTVIASFTTIYFMACWATANVYQKHALVSALCLIACTAWAAAANEGCKFDEELYREHLETLYTNALTIKQSLYTHANSPHPATENAAVQTEDGRWLEAASLAQNDPLQQL